MTSQNIIPKKEVVIVVPVYRNLQDTEKASFDQLIKVLGHYPISILHPYSFNVDNLIENKSNLSEVGMNDNWFKGKMTYSALCLNNDFYNNYIDYEYMLIYQLDAWVFRDELHYWIAKGYDYVGAPWVPADYILKRIIEYPWRQIRKLFPYNYYDIPQSIKHFSVGNGGFCLRRIPTMLDLIKDDTEIIKGIIKADIGEDLYISLVATKTHHLNIPDWRTALAFSWERAMKHCYRLNHHQLPFGCHSWQVPKRYKWWKTYIQI